MSNLPKYEDWEPTLIGLALLFIVATQSLSIVEKGLK